MNLEEVLQEHAKKAAEIEASNAKALESKRQQDEQAEADRQRQNRKIQDFLDAKVKAVFLDKGRTLAAGGFHYQIEARDLASPTRNVHNVEISIMFQLQGEEQRIYQFSCIGDLTKHAITLCQGTDGSSGGVVIPNYHQRSPDTISKEDVEMLFTAFVAKALENERRIKAII